MKLFTDMINLLSVGQETQGRDQYNHIMKMYLILEHTHTQYICVDR